jgi:CheY-like chemotaxis protein
VKVGPRMDYLSRKQAERTGITGEREHLPSEQHSASVAAPQETILIVENEDSNRRLMEQILDFAGYRYLSASNGLEALDIIAREQVDLVLIDLSMPIMDGYRTTEIIRLRPQCATLPIVAVTAHAMSDDRALALRSGCTDYLAKPFRPNQLLMVVGRLLGHAPVDEDSLA